LDRLMEGAPKVSLNCSTSDSVARPVSPPGRPRLFCQCLQAAPWNVHPECNFLLKTSGHDLVGGDRRDASATESCTKLRESDFGDTSQEVEACGLIVLEPELGSSSEEIADDGDIQPHEGKLLTEGPRSRRYVTLGVLPPQLGDDESSSLTTKATSTDL